MPCVARLAAQVFGRLPLRKLPPDEAVAIRARIIDVSRRSMTIEVTGTDDKIEAFERMVRPFGLIEMMRTGEIAISRGRGET